MFKLKNYFTIKLLLCNETVKSFVYISNMSYIKTYVLVSVQKKKQIIVNNHIFLRERKSTKCQINLTLILFKIFNSHFHVTKKLVENIVYGRKESCAHRHDLNFRWLLWFFISTSVLYQLPESIYKVFFFVLSLSV